MKFVSSLFLVLLLSVSVTARKRLTRGNIREHERRLDEPTKETMMSMSMMGMSTPSPSDAPSTAPSVSKETMMSMMSGTKGSRRLMSMTMGKGSKSAAPSDAPSSSPTVTMTMMSMMAKSQKNYVNGIDSF